MLAAIQNAGSPQRSGGELCGCPNLIEMLAARATFFCGEEALRLLLRDTINWMDWQTGDPTRVLRPSNYRGVDGKAARPLFEHPRQIIGRDAWSRNDRNDLHLGDGAVDGGVQMALHHRGCRRPSATH